MKRQHVGIVLGAMAPTIGDQLAMQGITVNPDALEHVQRDADAITRLSVRSLLTQAETRKARARLLKDIQFLVDNAPQRVRP